MLIIPMFLDISGGEFLLIVLAFFIVFGPKKMPEIARQIGKTMNELKKTTSDITREFKEGADQVKREVHTMKSDIIAEVNPLQSGIDKMQASIDDEAAQLTRSVRRKFGTGLGDDLPKTAANQPQAGETDIKQPNISSPSGSDNNPAAS